MLLLLVPLFGLAVLFGVYIQRTGRLTWFLNRYFYYLRKSHKFQRNTPPENYLSMHALLDWKAYPYSYLYDELENFLYSKIKARAVADISEYDVSDASRDKFKKYLLGKELQIDTSKSCMEKSSKVIFSGSGFELRRVVIDNKINGLSVDFILGLPDSLCSSDTIIALHGFTSSPKKIMGIGEIDYSNAIGLDFVKKGYMVVAPFVFGQGERLSPLAALASMMDATIEGIALENISSCIEYMGQEYGSSRFGIYGISGGATLALYSGALHDKVVCVAASNILHDRVKGFSDILASKGLFSGGVNKPYYHYFFCKYPFYFEYSFSKIAALICPKPLYVDNGKSDRYYHYYDAAGEYLKIHEYYKEQQSTGRFTYNVFEGYHEADVDSVVPWMLSNLQAKD